MSRRLQANKVCEGKVGRNPENLLIIFKDMISKITNLAILLREWSLLKRKNFISQVIKSKPVSEAIHSIVCKIINIRYAFLSEEVFVAGRLNFKKKTYKDLSLPYDQGSAIITDLTKTFKSFQTYLGENFNVVKLKLEGENRDVLMISQIVSHGGKKLTFEDCYCKLSGPLNPNLVSDDQAYQTNVADMNKNYEYFLSLIPKHNKGADEEGADEEGGDKEGGVKKEGDDGEGVDEEGANNEKGADEEGADREGADEEGEDGDEEGADEEGPSEEALDDALNTLQVSTTDNKAGGLFGKRKYEEMSDDGEPEEYGEEKSDEYIVDEVFVDIGHVLANSLQSSFGLLNKSVINMTRVIFYAEDSVTNNMLSFLADIQAHRKTPPPCDELLQVALDPRLILNMINEAYSTTLLLNLYKRLEEQNMCPKDLICMVQAIHVRSQEATTIEDNDSSALSGTHKTRLLQLLSAIKKLENVLKKTGLIMDDNALKSLRMRCNRSTARQFLSIVSNLTNRLLENSRFIELAKEHPDNIFKKSGDKQEDSVRVSKFVEDVSSILRDTFRADIDVEDFLVFMNLFNVYGYSHAQKEFKVGTSRLPLTSSAPLSLSQLCEKYHSKMHNLVVPKSPSTIKKQKSLTQDKPIKIVRGVKAIIVDEPTNTTTVDTTPPRVEEEVIPNNTHREEEIEVMDSGEEFPRSKESLDQLLYDFLLTRCDFRHLEQRNCFMQTIEESDIKDHKGESQSIRLLLDFQPLAGGSTKKIYLLSSAIVTAICRVINAEVESAQLIDDLALALCEELLLLQNSNLNICRIHVAGFLLNQWLPRHYQLVRPDGWCFYRSELQAFTRCDAMNKQIDSNPRRKYKEDNVADLKDLSTPQSLLNYMEELLTFYNNPENLNSLSPGEYNYEVEIIKAVIDRLTEIIKYFRAPQSDEGNVLPNINDGLPSKFWGSNEDFGYFKYLKERMLLAINDKRGVGGSKSIKQIAIAGNLYCFFNNIISNKEGHVKKLFLYKSLTKNKGMCFSFTDLLSALSHNINYVLSGAHFYPLNIPAMTTSVIKERLAAAVKESFILPITTNHCPLERIIKAVRKDLQDKGFLQSFNNDKEGGATVYCYTSLFKTLSSALGPMKPSNKVKAKDKEVIDLASSDEEEACCESNNDEDQIKAPPVKQSDADIMQKLDILYSIINKSSAQKQEKDDMICHLEEFMNELTL